MASGQRGVPRSGRMAPELDEGRLGAGHQGFERPPQVLGPVDRRPIVDTVDLVDGTLGLDEEPGALQPSPGDRATQDTGGPAGRHLAGR